MIRRTSALVASGLLVAIGGAPVEAGPQAKPRWCFSVEASASTRQSDPTAPFVGTATFRLDGTTVEVESVALPTNDISVGYIDATSHVFEFPAAPGRPWDGVALTTEDRIRPIPLAPGIYELRSRLRIVDGATGRLASRPGSTIDLTNPAGGVATWRATGRICFEA